MAGDAKKVQTRDVFKTVVVFSRSLARILHCALRSIQSAAEDRIRSDGCEEIMEWLDLPTDILGALVELSADGEGCPKYARRHGARIVERLQWVDAAAAGGEWRRR